MATEVGLTPPAVATRIRRLEERGLIRQFAACISAAGIGATTAFVDVTFEDADGHDEFKSAMGRLMAVQECHRLAGSAHYLLKVRTRSTEELDALLTTVLPRVARGASVRVSMVLSTIKESPVFPLPRASSAEA